MDLKDLIEKTMYLSTKESREVQYQYFDKYNHHFSDRLLPELKQIFENPRKRWKTLELLKIIKSCDADVTNFFLEELIYIIFVPGGSFFLMELSRIMGYFRLQEILINLIIKSKLNFYGAFVIRAIKKHRFDFPKKKINYGTYYIQLYPKNYKWNRNCYVGDENVEKSELENINAEYNRIERLRIRTIINAFIDEPLSNGDIGYLGNLFGSLSHDFDDYDESFNDILPAFIKKATDEKFIGGTDTCRI